MAVAGGRRQGSGHRLGIGDTDVDEAAEMMINLF